jgi:hypothetical protein
LQGLVDSFVLALGLGVVGSAGDGFAAQWFEHRDELGAVAESGPVEGCAVVGQEQTWHLEALYSKLHDGDRVGGGLAGSGSAGDHEA